MEDMKQICEDCGYADITRARLVLDDDGKTRCFDCSVRYVVKRMNGQMDLPDE